MPALHSFQKRDDCVRDSNGELYCNNTPWSDWARWVVLVIIIVAFFLLFVACSCVTARRRRRMGRHPMWGTGWAARNGHGEAQYVGPQQYAQPYYNPNPNPQFGAAPPPPAYSPPPGGYYANGGHQGNYEMGNMPTSPPPAHPHDTRNAAGEPVYEQPPGPPPNKAREV
ncbi:chitin synthesis regulation, resistance to congo red-domain-containing protein [Phyllosticta citrichinensis]|uniref:Chitin synthesis regulation, resistance to congo red-domain-containing protein n=1 Tax=Phyllosticta citrichinensis TaxID=1130410 RepID=A0ABR1XHJ4_9PEZI